MSQAKKYRFQALQAEGKASDSAQIRKVGGAQWWVPSIRKSRCWRDWQGSYGGCYRWDKEFGFYSMQREATRTL